MTKKVLKRKAKVNPDAISHAITQLYYDIDTVKLQMEFLTDAELYDHCLHHIEMYQHTELDRLYTKISSGGSLAENERKSLEAFCILANTELCLSV